MGTKAQLIDAIQQINRSAPREFLDLFDLDALRHYYEHLQRTVEPRGGHSTWTRLGDTPAIVTRQPAA